MSQRWQNSRDVRERMPHLGPSPIAIVPPDTHRRDCDYYQSWRDQLPTSEFQGPGRWLSDPSSIVNEK